MEHPADILVVDDTPANLQLLVNLLAEQDYKVRPVTSGEAALKAVQSRIPDLILLDINMPGISGYTVCERLKANEATRDIPVIFISALTEVAEKITAFSAGGVDYVTKPFQVDEVLARVGTHLALRRSRSALEASLQRLRELEALRDSLTHMIAHDMRSPLLAVSLGLEMIQDIVPESAPVERRMVTDARAGVSILVGMVTQMLEVSRLETGNVPVERKVVDMAGLAREVVSSYRSRSGARRLELTGAATVLAEADPELLRRVIDNLVGNAVKYTSPDGLITLTFSADPDRARCEITDNGPGISAPSQARLFTKFGQLSGDDARRGYGLGLAFVRLAVEAHGGEVGVRSEPGQGSTFWFCIPRRPAPAA